MIDQDIVYYLDGGELMTVSDKERFEEAKHVDPITFDKEDIMIDKMNPCKCGSLNLSVKCTSGDHYEEDFVQCQDCFREGFAEFGIHDAIRIWNRANPVKVKTIYG